MFKTAAVSILICLFAIQGCTISPKKEKEDIYRWPGEVRLFTPEVRQELFAEQKHLNGSRQRLGLALSGGGVRSASFGIGVLAGLEKQRILRHVDVLSTVSGGGYAGYWFMNSLLNLEHAGADRNFERSELFADCYHRELDLYKPYENGSKNYPPCPGSGPDGKLYRDNKYRFQYHLSGRTDLVYYAESDIYQYPEFAGKIVAHVPSIVMHHVSNSLFDWGGNVSRWRKYYQNGIGRTYGLVPQSIEEDDYGARRYLNAETSLGLRNAMAEGLTFQRLKDYTIDRWKKCSPFDRDAGTSSSCNRPPLWIINTTAGVANRIYEWMEAKQPLSKSVFSITPFGYGAGEYGFVDEAMEQISVTQAVSISGAAIDAQVKGGKHTGNGWAAVGEHLICLNLGYSIDNYNPSRSRIGFHRFLPWPFYYLHGFTRNESSVDIYLSDGGHSENLGAYPLIIRGIPQIIVVDAEYDNEGKFEALKLLRSALEDEKLWLSFYDYKPACQEPACKPSSWKQENFEDILKDFDPHNAKYPVLHFKVKGFHQRYVSDEEEKNFVEIIYVKSSINLDPVLMDKDNCNNNEVAYPCTVVAYVKHEQDSKRIESGNRFPQHRTFAGEVKSSPQYYYAYRDLATYVVQHYLEWKNGKVSLKKSPAGDR